VINKAKGKLVILAGGVSSRMKNSVAAGEQIDEKILKDAVTKSKGMIRIGSNGRPFLDYLLLNALQSGYKEFVVVISEKDNSIREYYEKLSPGNLNLSYAVQPVPLGRVKPLGTADALYCALKSKPEWTGSFFTVCNSDNLYSHTALKLLLEPSHANALIDYDRDGLEVDKERIEKFAVTKKDDSGFLVDIVEKPSKEEIESAKGDDGSVRVSMNIFKFNYDMIYPYLENVPLHPVRQEKEIPSAIKMMIAANPKSLYCYPLCERVPDLTSKNDILIVKKFLENNYSDFSFSEL